MDRILIPECYPDCSLLRTLGFTSKFDHAGVQGKNNLLNKLRKREKSGQPGIGLIESDADAFEKSSVNDYYFQLQSLKENYNVKLLGKPKQSIYLIEIHPRLEEWIIRAAKDCRIVLKDFKLPNHPQDLHKAISLQTVPKEFENLVSALLEKKSAPVLALKEIIQQALDSV